MFRTTFCLIALLLVCPLAVAAPSPDEIDPEKAKADPDFLLQGEYLGEGLLPDGKKSKAGAQVIGLGDGTFRVVLYRGGLPGAGWMRGQPQFTLDARREGKAAVMRGDKLGAKIEGGTLTLSNADGKTLLAMKRTERKSPTLGQKPPQGAVVLFDGSNTDNFPDGKLTEMNTLEAGTTAKSQHEMARLHLEFRLSWRPKARGQGRSNSGVYIGGLPEIQILDSFGLEGAKNECGAFYGRRQPDVNMCLPPLVWQTLDVEFSQPKRDAEGKLMENILVTVRHNGVVVHEGYDTRRKESEPRRLHLQKHGNRVQYRNIWLVEPK